LKRLTTSSETTAPFYGCHLKKGRCKNNFHSERWAFLNFFLFFFSLKLKVNTEDRLLTFTFSSQQQLLSVHRCCETAATRMHRRKHDTCYRAIVMDGCQSKVFKPREFLCTQPRKCASRIWLCVPISSKYAVSKPFSVSNRLCY